MRCGNRADESNRPAFLFQTEAQILILGIHKKGLVEGTGFVQCAAPEQQTGALDPVRLRTMFECPAEVLPVIRGSYAKMLECLVKRSEEVPRVDLNLAL